MTMTMPELDDDTLGRMRPLWAAVDRAIRTDTGMLVEIAELARRVRDTKGGALASARLASFGDAALSQARERPQAVTVAPEKPRRAGRGRRARLTPEEREARAAQKREDHRVRMAARAPEERARYNAIRRERSASLSPEAQEKVKAKAREKYRRQVAADAPDFDDLIAAGALD